MTILSLSRHFSPPFFRLCFVSTDMPALFSPSSVSKCWEAATAVFKWPQCVDCWSSFSPHPFVALFKSLLSFEADVSWSILSNGNAAIATPLKLTIHVDRDRPQCRKQCNFTLHTISSHSSFRLIWLCQVKPSRQRWRVLMVCVIIHAAMWNSREDTANCVQQLLLYGLVHKIKWLFWSEIKLSKEQRPWISDKLTQQPTLNILTRLGETDLCAVWGICGLAQIILHPARLWLPPSLHGRLPECSLNALTLRCPNKSHTQINAHASKMHVLPVRLYLVSDVISVELPLLTPWTRVWCIITLSACICDSSSR